MGRSAYIRKRLVLMVFVLFGVTVVIFGMVRVLPGDPAFLILGDRATDEKAAQLREILGLNKPIHEQYWMFVSGLVTGNMGQSLLYRQPVADLVLSRVPITLALAAYAMSLAAIITLTFGITAAVMKGKWPDQLIRVGFLFALTTPSFWFGILLLRHVLRNALLSTVTIFGLQFGFLVGGTIVVETVFAVPGTGQLLVSSISGRDYPVVQAITVISAFLVILVNLVVDLSYSVLDPRVT